PGLLGDQAWAALACIDAYEVAGRPQDLAPAGELLAWMRECLAAPGGGFYDTPAGHETTGMLACRQTPLKENSVAALACLRYARYTHAAEHERIAHDMLAAFPNVAETQGYFAA